MATLMAGDAHPLVTQYLEKICGYTVRRYGWAAQRGNAMVAPGDLAQIAAVELVVLARKWDGILAQRGKTPDEDTGGLFWTYLANAVKMAVFDTLDHSGVVYRAGEEPRTTRSVQIDANDEEVDLTDWVQTSDWGTHAEASMYGRLTLLAIADFYDTLPLLDKVAIIFRCIDRMPTQLADELLGGKKNIASGSVQKTVEQWRMHARNQFQDDQEPLPRRYNKPWQPSAKLNAYVQRTYDCTLEELVDWMSYELHEDFGTLVDVLTTRRTNTAEQRTTTAEQEAQVDELALVGMSPRQIAERTGLTERVVRRVLDSTTTTSR